MPELMIMCPNTDVAVPTGITADKRALEKTDSYANETYIDEYNMLTDCPECGETHVWHADDVFLNDEGADGET